MQTHHGQIIEKVVRRNGYSISDLARMTNVNRRSVYNWFNQPHLKPEIIYRIGRVLNYDFSVELPELFTPEDFKPETKRASFDRINQRPVQEQQNNYWKDKYIELLERYNSLLLSNIPVWMLVTTFSFLS